MRISSIWRRAAYNDSPEDGQPPTMIRLSQVAVLYIDTNNAIRCELTSGSEHPLTGVHDTREEAETALVTLQNRIDLAVRAENMIAPFALRTQ